MPPEGDAEIEDEGLPDEIRNADWETAGEDDEDE